MFELDLDSIELETSSRNRQSHTLPVDQEGSVFIRTLTNIIIIKVYLFCCWFGNNDNIIFNIYVLIHNW